MELKTYIAILWRRKWIILATTLLITVIATALTFIATPIYVASTTLRVATFGSGVSDAGRTDINYTVRLMNTYSQIVRSGTVRRQIAQQLNLPKAPTISVNIIPNTELMQIQVEATSSLVARNVANAAAEILMAQSRELYSGSGQTTQDILGRQISQVEEELTKARQEYEQILADSPNDTTTIAAAAQSIELKQRTYASLLDQYEQVRVEEALRANAITVIEPAVAPTSPAKPRHEVNIALGFLVGVFGGIGLALLFENLDTTLYTTSQIETITNLTTLGQIPWAHQHLRIVHSGNGNQPHVEAFRRLRINILASSLESFPQTLMVTSAQPKEGKSTVLANLAVTIAQSGRRVAVVDCDMHAPTMHNLFSLPNDRGLTSILAERIPVDDVLQDSEYPRLQVITSGPTLPNPTDLIGSAQLTSTALVGQLTQGTELLGSPQMSNMITQLKNEFDVILLDTPALLTVTDAAVLVPLVDDVVLVVAREQSTRDALRAVHRQLKNVRAKSIGIVVNRAEKSTTKVGFAN